MPGLRNRSTWEPLLLKASCIKSCAIGCSLGITTRLTYANTEMESVEGVFVYPLGEKEVVVGFEAAVASRAVGVQIQSRTKLEECCLDCCPSNHLDAQSGSGKDCGCCGTFGRDVQCTNGHLVLDEDLERTTFIVSTGVIAPLDLVTVILSTTMELPTLENGAIHMVYPSVLSPLVRGKMVPSRNEHSGRWDENGPTSCFGGAPGKQDRPPGSHRPCAHAIFTSTATNYLPYEFSFQLLVRGACLLAGLESPTHALRADADPGAQSASATYITLAEEHPYDRPVEIILHLSEPHCPQVILERGRLTFQEYEQQICTRRDFIRYARKEAEPEKKLEFVRKRFHKDILSNPVLMLNFCPDLLNEPMELHRATREIFFLLDRNSSMSGSNMERLKEGMMVAIKSLPPGTLLNIVGFGSLIKTLFLTSKLCTNETVTAAYEYTQKMKADLGGTNLLGALSWVYQQPGRRGYPRQVFLITDGTVGNVGRVLELVRRNAGTARCCGLGLGPSACRRLLQGVAKVTGGNAEFLGTEERVQPKLIRLLKKAFEPVVTDVHIDWYVPDDMEALLSPSEIPPLYPGNCLMGYCTLYDMSGFKTKKNDVSGRVSRGLSRGSVSVHSQDELCPPRSMELFELQAASSEHGDIEEALREISREISSEFSCARPLNASAGYGMESDSSNDVRRRIARASYVQDQYTLTHCSVSSDRAPLHSSSPSDSTAPHHDTGSLPHGLERMAPLEPRALSRWESPWTHASSSDGTDAGTGREECQRRRMALARSALSGRSFSSPQGELDLYRLRRALEKVSFHQTLGGRVDEGDGRVLPNQREVLSRRSLTDSNSLVFPASPLDWDNFTDPECLFAAASPEETAEPRTQCRSVIHGLLGDKPVSWEVVVDLSQLWRPKDLGPVAGDWKEIMHQLTARSVIRDFENMAEREPEAEHGPSKRYRMKAIQTSKACNTTCMYTSFVAIDTNTNEGPVGSVEVRNRGSRSTARQRGRAYSVGLDRRPSTRDSEDLEDTSMCTDRDDTPASPCSLTSWDSSTGGTWNPASPSAVSTRSQRSMESWSVESFFGSRFTLGRLRTTESMSRQMQSKPHCLSENQPDSDNRDYMSLIWLQLASGAFLLTEQYSECVQIPLDRLKRASPYTCHRRSLSPPFRCSFPTTSSKPLRGLSHAVSADASIPALRPRARRYRSSEPTNLTLDTKNLGGASPDPLGGVMQADSGRGSETDVCEGFLLEPPDQSDDQQDLEGSSWATAVALAWLEHRCAGFFVEWELVAAKADFWLRSQRLPEGVDLAGLKGAARQLFLLIRHWDENIKLNMLCYNPDNM
nr:von Willebrand factor A domain-containing protein 5B2-like isoform X1 [Paramormyrops kingsleyae]XP_023674195.1 von Willebrand factor A domain-containing protein 5B2-like isoform X1 [Paramormyrops kingsleyae]XP_023674196.1 von Willebrand factor A domain-containing protein 5B2-like isoform X1 [Paramormyrops kingsleyae]XP_023674197.1 von Willebrand factor A domain-containing protein 5B2-like isoform X1 [Paramormyrops kingsleyae]